MRFCLRALALAAFLLAGCSPPEQPSIAPEQTPAPSVEIVSPPSGHALADPPAVLTEPTPIDPKREEAKPTIALPPAPTLTKAGTALLIQDRTTFELSPDGHLLILDFETGGRSGYNPHPEWPQGASGTTIGIGYDCGYASADVIRNDWRALSEYDRTRLAATAGITGTRARAKVAMLQDILVQWNIATTVFDHVDVAREFGSARRAMPGFEDLRPNAQAALISLGFNRGWAMSGPNRVEMRAIRDLVPSANYGGMALQLRKMVHVWTGTAIERGMTRRRLAEAKLMEVE